MAYNKTTWVNDETPLNAENMNKIESGIEQNANDIDELKQSSGNSVKETTPFTNAATLYTSLQELSQSNRILAIKLNYASSTYQISSVLKDFSVTEDSIKISEIYRHSLDSGEYSLLSHNASGFSFGNGVDRIFINSSGVFNSYNAIQLSSDYNKITVQSSEYLHIGLNNNRTISVLYI